MYLLAAVGAGADLIRNADATLAWKARRGVKVDPRDAIRSRLQARASGASIDRGGGLAVQGPYAIATCCWNTRGWIFQI